MEEHTMKKLFCLVPVYLAEDGKSLHRKMDVPLTKGSTLRMQNE